MSTEVMNMALEGVDKEYANESAATRRRFIGVAGAALGSAGLMAAAPGSAMAATIAADGDNDLGNILRVAVTAEVLATIVNTVGPEKVQLDKTTRENIQAAARQELIHYDVLRSLGAKAYSTKIWVPDAVFSSRENLLKTLVAGDQIFINAYLLGTTVAARARQPKIARYASEIMGVEAVHRALALQSLGELGNDRAFMKFEFKNIFTAVKRLQEAGFGIGERGKGAGEFYTLSEVRKRTPNPEGVNTRTPQ